MRDNQVDEMIWPINAYPCTSVLSTSVLSTSVSMICLFPTTNHWNDLEAIALQ